MDVIDRKAKVDPDFHKNRFMAPRVIWENEAGAKNGSATSVRKHETY